MSFIHRKDEIGRRNEDKNKERRERRDEKLRKRGKFKNDILTRVEMFNKWRFRYQMNYLEYDGIKVIESVTKRLESINMTNNDKENEEEENRVYEDVEKIIRDEMKRVYKDLSCDIILNSIQVDINELEENEELDTERKEELMINLITFKDMIEKEKEEREKEEEQLINLKIDEYIRGKKSNAMQEFNITIARMGRESDRTEWLSKNEIYEKGIRIYRESMICRALDNDKGEVDDVTKRYIKDLQPKADDRTNDMIEERQEEIKKNRRERRENNIKRKEIIEVTSNPEERKQLAKDEEKKDQVISLDEEEDNTTITKNQTISTMTEDEDNSVVIQIMQEIKRKMGEEMKYNERKQQAIQLIRAVKEKNVDLNDRKE